MGDTEMKKLFPLEFYILLVLMTFFSENFPADSLANSNRSLTISPFVGKTETGNQPKIVVIPDTLDFDTTLTGYSVIRDLTIYNIGMDTLEITDIVITDSAFSVDTIQFQVVPLDSFLLQVSFLPYVFSYYSADMVIVNNDPLQDSVRVFMQGWGSEPPIIYPFLFPDSLPVTVPLGDSVSENLYINNNSPIWLNWTAEIEYLPTSNKNSQDLGDTLFTRDVTALTPHQATLIRGVAFDGTHIWIAGADLTTGAYIYKFTPDWQLINFNPQPITFPLGFRDLVYYGGFLYGVTSNSLVEMDTLSGLATGSIVSAPLSDMQAVTVDPQTGYFWAYGLSQNIYVFDSGGVMLNQFPYTGPPIGGMAWDAWSPGGPYVWLWVADGPAGGPNCTAVQWSVNSGQLTGVSFTGHEMNGDPNADDQPAGADIGVINTRVTFLGLQSSNYLPGDGHDFVVGYSLGLAPHNWLSISPISGTIAPWNYNTVNVKIRGTMGTVGDSVHNAKIKVHSNNPLYPYGEVPVRVEVTPVVGLTEKNLSQHTSFLLMSNYPNPFNSVTHLRFEVTGLEFVELTIYDVLGRKVKTLVNERKAAGTYTVQWDGTDDAGQPVASGVYLYRLWVSTPTGKAGDYTAVRKMLLIR